MTGQAKTSRIGKSVLSIIAIGLTLGLGWWLYQHRQAEKAMAEKSAKHEVRQPRQRRAGSELIELPDNLYSTAPLKTVAAVVPEFASILHLRGTLAIDPNRLSHVHSRFAGQVTELATITGLRSQQVDSSAPTKRLLQNFDFVQQGMTLAVIRSKDLGEKKSALAEGLIRLRVEKRTLENYRAMAASGSFPERQVREQKYKVEQAQLDIFTNENTLRAFQVSEEDIKQVKDAADKYRLEEESDTVYAQEWSKVEVMAPITGEIVEKSVIVGDIVDSNADLFKIADLSVLAVYLHPYEEELALLDKLPKPWHVTIRVPAFPEIGELPCEIDRSSPMIDPNEHMALLIGTVKNPQGRLKALQFVTANVGIPAEPGVVQIPANSVIDFGHEAVAFVQQPNAQRTFERRKIKIVQRYFDVIHVKSELTDEGTKLGLKPIQEGERVVSGGVLEFEDAMQQLQNEQSE